MKKKFMLAVGICLLLISTTAYAAMGLVHNLADLSAAYSTVGGQPHYVIKGTSTTKELRTSAGNVKEIIAEGKLFRNNVLVLNGQKLDYNMLQTSKSLDYKEHSGNIAYTFHSTGKIKYSDGTTADDLNYGYQWVNSVQ